MSRNKLILFCSLGLAALAILLVTDQSSDRSIGEASKNENSQSAIEGSDNPPRRLNDFIANSIDERFDFEVLVELATKHGERMRELMLSDPEKALESALSYSEYAALPTEIQNLVEEPFSEIASIEIIAICDDDHTTPETKQYIVFEDGVRGRLSNISEPRTFFSKRNIPIQGIRLGEHVITKPQVFDRLDGNDQAWALENLNLGNESLGHDFLTGEPIIEEATVAVAGGFVFAFSNRENLESLEKDLKELDTQIGLNANSSALLEVVAMKVNNRTRLKELIESAKEISAQDTLETRSVLVIRVDFPDNTEIPYTKSEIEALFDNSVSPALAEFSYNKTSVTTTATTSVFRLSSTDTYSSDENTLHDDAVAAYISDGNADPFTEYDIVSVLFPDLGYAWAGLASIGGNKQWLHNNVAADTVLHELGHNYGLLHASYWVFDNANVNSTNPIDPTGANEEYGDPYDVMGEGDILRGHFHVAAKQTLGWLDNSQWGDLSSADDNGTYRVYRFDDVEASGLQGLRIAKSAGSDHYWVSYRKLYPGIPNFDKGAYINWERAGQTSANNRSWLIDSTPGSADGKVDAGISLGRTFADTDSNIFITPLAAGQDSTGSYLDISVNFGPFDGNQPPTGTLTGPSAGTARTPVTFSLSVNDPEGDDLAYSWNFGDGVIEPSLNTIDHSFPVGGEYEISVTISDKKGGILTLQSSVTISDPITVTNTRTSGTTRNLLSLAANTTRVVASGEDGIFLYSDDGTTWSSDTLPGFNANVFVRDIIWTGSEFIAVGADVANGDWVGAAFSSADGSSWSRDFTTSNAVGNFGFISVAANADSSIIIAVGSDAKLYRRISSAEWTQLDMDLSEGINISNSASISFGDGRFIVGGYDFTNQTLVLQKSLDGATWEDISADAATGPQGHSLRTLDFLNGGFLGSGFTSRVRYSIDSGDTWLTNQTGDTYEMTSFAFGNAIYSAHGINVTNGNSLLDLLSIDGRNWKEVSTIPSQSLNDRIFFESTFVSVGDGGLIIQTDPFIAPTQDPYMAWIIGFVSDGGGQGANANPDQDWAPNYIEYALGSDPSDPASVPTPPALSRNSEGRIVVSIFRFEKTELLISLETSIDLINWTPLAASQATDTDSLLELVTTQDYLDSLPFYIRIKVSSPN